ncbi:MAG: hypothetical protein HYT79_12570, partial [Elusimicrobia bacterium]|nr:hypothetical protein [Elusimicrobiota bacterium]
DEVFKKYDMRGIVGKQFEIEDAKILGRAAANYLLENYLIVQKKGVVVGHDVRVSSPQIAQNLIEGLLDFGIIIRPLSDQGLESYVRVSIGTPFENRTFVQALKKVLNNKC